MCELLLFSCRVVSATPWIAARRVSLSFTVSQSLLKLVCIESVMPSNHVFIYFKYMCTLLLNSLSRR